MKWKAEIGKFIKATSCGNDKDPEGVVGRTFRIVQLKYDHIGNNSYMGFNAISGDLGVYFDKQNQDDGTGKQKWGSACKFMWEPDLVAERDNKLKNILDEKL